MKLTINTTSQMLVFEERGNRSTRRKPLGARVENQQTQPTYDAESRNRTWATLVGGECSHHCTIPDGEEYYEVSNERGVVLATKNHQGGLDDPDYKSNGKIFERPGSKQCPLKLIPKYLSHLNPESSNLFQRPRSSCKSFNPTKDEVWFCSVPLGHNLLENMLCAMTSRAGIQPYFTNHSIRATTVTVLSAANYETRHIKAITGHQSEASIESYSNTPTFHQFNVECDC